MFTEIKFDMLGEFNVKSAAVLVVQNFCDNCYIFYEILHRIC